MANCVLSVLNKENDDDDDDNACFETSHVKFHARVASVGESGKKIKIKKRSLIFHVFRQALPYGRLAQIWGYVFVSWT